MTQLIHGVLLGAPGIAGSPSIGHFYGSGSPANSTDAMIINAQLGSLYSDYTTPGLWFKGANGWQQITIP
jgi:hypothetical protein